AGMIRPGELRHKIGITHKETLGTDDLGQPIKEESQAVFAMRAKVKQLSGRELALAQRLWQESQYEITTRYNSGIKMSDTILFMGKRLAIGHIDYNLETPKRWLTILCKEVV